MVAEGRLTGDARVCSLTWARGEHGDLVRYRRTSFYELLDSLDIGKAVLAGVSMGGYIALRMWARRPDRIAAMVPSNTKAEAIPRKSSP